MMENTKAFEMFLLDGGIGCPDTYLQTEREDFSPEGLFDASAINRYADNRVNDIKYALIA